jgi:hypothetical protein
VRATATAKGKTVSTKDITKRKPSATIDVPIRALEGIDVLALGFRQEMFSVEDFGGVDVGAGLGTDFILLKWRGKEALVRGSELLKAWVATFAPDDADRM